MFISKSHSTVTAVFDTDFVCVCVCEREREGGRGEREREIFTVKSIGLWGFPCRWHTYNFSLFNLCTLQKIYLLKHDRVCSCTMMKHLVTLKHYLGGYFPGLWVNCGGPHLCHPYLWNTGSFLKHVRSDVPVESRNLSYVVIYVESWKVMHATY